MLRPAACNDFLELFAKHKDSVTDMPECWGLKLTGTVFVHEQLAEFKPARVLEAGAGLSRHFHDRYGSKGDYWMVDKSGFYDAERFERSTRLKPRQTFVNTLLGENNRELPGDFFDMTFSISVLEHVPIDDIPEVCRDMYRVTAPGGVTVHSIDLHYSTGKEHASRWLENLTAAGFVPEIPDKVSTEVVTILPDGSAIMFEPLEVQYLTYTSAKDKWKPIRKLTDRFFTLLVIMRKPA